jgi:hypothetical protein
MMIIHIPTSRVESWYEQNVTLDGVKFRLRLMWSERVRRWYCDLLAADGTAIRSGIKVVADRPLTQRLSSDSRPAGEMWSVDRTGGGVDPDLRDLGDRVLLLYVEEDSVA